MKHQQGSRYIERYGPGNVTVTDVNGIRIFNAKGEEVTAIDGSPMYLVDLGNKISALGVERARQEALRND